MWKLIKISQRPYLMNCIFGEDNAVTFILYDHKESWCETLTLDEVKRKSKLLNRRYDFNEEIVRETLKGGDLELATLEQPDAGRTEKAALKLKYRVKNCPFHYEWSLKKQTMQQLQTTLVRPLCSALMGCHEQIEILTESLKKKDAEILQYRKEGAILSRKTLATKLFDFEEFANKYQANNRLAADFNELGKFLVSTEATKERPSSTGIQIKEQESSEIKETILKKQNIPPWSPGQRKRKIQELKQKHLERNMKTRKQNIVYESSQSQDTTTTGSSQSADFDFEKKKLDLKSKTTSAQKVEQKVEDLKSTTDAITEQEDKASKSSSANKQEFKETLQDSKINSESKQKTQQTGQDSKSTSTATTKNQQNDSNTIAMGITTQIALNTLNKVQSESHSKSTTAEDKEEAKSIEIQSDTDSEDIILTPRKSSSLLRNSRGNTSYVDNTDSESGSDDTIKKTHRKITRNLSRSFQEESMKNLEKNDSNKDNAKETRNGIKLKALNCLAFNDVVEISTDSDCSEQPRRYPKRRNTTSTPTKTRGRVTRSSPQSPGVDKIVHRQRRSSVGVSAADCRIFESASNKSSRTTTKPKIVGDISSQLDAIRKELESLEALRLADLKQRTCSKT